MVGDHIYLNIGGIFSLKPFNLTGIAGGLLFISLSFDEPLLKQYNQSKPVEVHRLFVSSILIFLVARIIKSLSIEELSISSVKLHELIMSSLFCNSSIVN